MNPVGQKSTRPKRRIGDILRIELPDGSKSYARVLGEASFAFYDGRFDKDPEISEILTLPIAFEIAVMKYAVTKGGWRIIGTAPLELYLQKVRPRFIQDALNVRHFQIYEDGEIRESSREECEGLERCAVWDPEHVEDRLADHYAGRPNKWLESMKIKS